MQYDIKRGGILYIKGYSMSAIGCPHNVILISGKFIGIKPKTTTR
jgi:hypothetical protein